MMCQSTWSKGKEAKAVKRVTLFTDGSCLGNPGPGGWACILRYGKHERILRGVALRTTNNRMELEAAINGLLVLTERCSVTVITDSKYLQQGITVYLVRWQRRNWRNSRGQTTANRDLWERLASVSGQHETKWQ
jgi:ribonuclease HI